MTFTFTFTVRDADRWHVDVDDSLKDSKHLRKPRYSAVTFHQTHSSHSFYKTWTESDTVRDSRAGPLNRERLQNKWNTQ